MTSLENRQPCISCKAKPHKNLFFTKKNIHLFLQAFLFMVCLNALEQYNPLTLPTLAANWYLSVGDTFLLNATFSLK